MKLQNVPLQVLVLAIIVLCFITRLPQILSPNLLLDGDESILGLMAKHLSEGKEFPVIFYGQSYGFSLIETLFGATAFKLFGVNAIALRLSLLLLWSIGTVFIFLTLLELTDKKWALILILLFIFIPAWAIGSMKARGGYITAFTLSSFVIYWIIQTDKQISNFSVMILGMITTIIYLSRLFWIPGLLAIFVYYFLIKNKNLKGFILLVTISVLTYFLFDFIVPKPNVYWHPDPEIGADFIKYLLAIPNRIYYNMTGSYCLENNIKLGIFDRIATLLWANIIILLGGMQIHRIIKRKYLPWSHVFFIATLLTLSYTPFISHAYGARYLLPYSQFLVLCLVVETIDFIETKAPFRTYIYSLIGILTITSFGALMEFKNFNFLHPVSEKNIPEKQRVDDLISFLLSKDVHHTFVLESMFQWEVMFYSKEQIACRYTSSKDRYPTYPNLVNQAYIDRKPTALIGYKSYMLGLDTCASIKNDFIFIDNRYFVLFNPSNELLKSQSFELPE